MDRYEEAALEFANKVRADLKKEPAIKLRNGVRKSGTDCPVARTIGFGVKTDPWTTIYAGQRWNNPMLVSQFIRRFDAMAYPELILDEQSV